MIIKNLNKNFLIYLLLVLLIFLIDRFSKIYVIYLNGRLNGEEIYSSKFLNIHLVWNEGIAFGLFSVNETAFYNILTFIIMLVILFVFYLIIRSNGFEKFALLMIFSGAISNLFDRIIYRAVPDFLDFHVENFHWFIFNVADIFITIGVIFMIIYEFTYKNKKNKI
tara:strand:- start:538 stop:1035 length:498 start_codon:yes stop_codon:yes gene_type:complete